MSDWKPGCCLLILEDEPMILMDLEFAAEDYGCDVFCATGVRHALELLETNPTICGAILDVNLGEGQTCLPIARELDRRRIPYILHSGDLNRQNELVRQLGAVLVPKPADPQRVIRVAIEAAGGECG
ncbi:MAG: response regulator [Croceibacterium sp.]|jgi:CheY-like chemotaxis protein